MFQIDVMSRKPVYEQIIEQMERLVLVGLLKPHDQIPSVRSLSVDLSINPNTIQKAYAELDRRGIIYAVPGRGCFVSENAVERLSVHKRGQLGTLMATMRELRIAGISKEEILQCVETVYLEKGVTVLDSGK